MLILINHKSVTAFLRLTLGTFALAAHACLLTGTSRAFHRTVYLGAQHLERQVAWQSSAALIVPAAAYILVKQPQHIPVFICK